MDSISSSCSTTPGCWDNAAASRSYDAVQFSRIAVSSQESKDITIFTDEGDKVTLSYDHQTQASYANLKALSYRGNFAISEDQAAAKEILAKIQGERFQFEDSQTLTITVDGDLNEQELADIQKAIKGIDEIMTDLLQGGEVSEAMIEDSDIRDLESIASLEADYRYEKTVQIEQIALKESKTYSRYELPENVTPDKQGKRIDSFMKLIDKMSKIVEDSNVKPAKFFRPLKRLFENIIHEHNEDRPGSKVKRHAAELIGSELFQRIKQLVEKDDSDTTPISSV